MNGDRRKGIVFAENGGPRDTKRFHDVRRQVERKRISQGVPRVSSHQKIPPHYVDPKVGRNTLA